MNTQGASDFSKSPRQYRREDAPDLSRLVEESEQKHREVTTPIFTTFKGYRLAVDPGVLNPALSLVGDLLASHLHIPAEAVVLDLGTGTGCQALLAAERAKKVLAIDNQREAVVCAQKNVALHGLQAKIDVRQGDLFAPVAADEQFDVIVFNIPYVPWKPETPWQAANFDEGHQLLGRFLAQAKYYLHPGGRVLMTWSDLGDTAYLHTLLAEQGYAHTIQAAHKVGDLGIYVYELRATGANESGGARA